MNSKMQRQLDELLAPSSGLRMSLRLPKELQEEYAKAERPVSQFLPMVVAFGTVIIDLFTFVDYQVQHSVLARSLILRLGVFTPCAIVSIIMLRSHRWRAYSQPITLLLCLVATFCCVAASPRFNQITVVHTQFTFLLLIFTMSIARLQLTYYFCYLLLLLVGDALFLNSSVYVDITEKITIFSLVTSGSILALIANHVLECSYRFNYFLGLREKLKSKELARLNKHLATLSQRDGLTGLANRRHFDEALHAAWHTALQERTPLSLIMADVDHFKQLNDTYGHLAGDQVLAMLGDVFLDGLRSQCDVAARYGGEEFTVLLPNFSCDEALQAAERIRNTVKAMQITTDTFSATLSVSISCGVATLHPQSQNDPSQLIHLADHALYRAKRSGRDRVCA